MPKAPSVAGDWLKKKKEPEDKEPLYPPEVRKKIKARLTAYLPALGVYLAMRFLLNADMWPSLGISFLVFVGVGLLVGFRNILGGPKK